MNEDILKGKWAQLKGRVKEQWGKLTDDEIDQSRRPARISSSARSRSATDCPVSQAGATSTTG